MERFVIRRCPRSDLHSALKCLHAGLSSDQQAMLVETLGQLTSDEALLAGLLVAELAGKAVSATWVQFTPGSTAVVWPPALESPAASELLLAAAELLDRQQISLSQMLFAGGDLIDEALLATGGFRRLASLAYLTLERSSFPHPTESTLTFEAHADREPARLGAILARSYQQSLDCPELNDVRDPAEVIEGYQAQGQYNSAHWFLVRAEGADVGCLILTEHPRSENCELVYMGVVPEARGRGYGEQIIRFAGAHTSQLRAERLVLAVDERNEPALAMYRRVGFVMWDRRTVYARIRKREKR